MVGRRRGEARQAEAEPSDIDFELLFGSGLFDDAWYRMCLDRPLDRAAAVRHYLRAGRDSGLTPHPLFDPSHCAAGLELDPDCEPLVEYLSSRAFAADVHPLFDVTSYVTEHPEALDHAEGPIGHYCDAGAQQGARVNEWYRPNEREPRGLVDWIWAEGSHWADRRRLALPTWGRVRPRGVAGPELGPVTDPRAGMVTVVMVVEHGEEDLARSIESLMAQTTTSWELLLLGLEGGPWLLDCELPDDPRIRVLEGPFSTRWAARNHAMGVARGSFLAWMVEGDRWTPGRISSLFEGLLTQERRWVQDCARDERPDVVRRHASRPYTRERLLAGATVEISTLMVSRDLAVAVGGFDEDLQGGRLLDFMLKIGAHDEGCFVPRLGVRVERNSRREGRRPPANNRPYVDFDKLPGAGDAVLNGHLVDWPGLRSRSTEAGLVSVVVPTHHDWEMTRLAVQRVVECREPSIRVEVVVVDNGCPLVTSLVLSALTEQFEDVRLVRNPANRGFALGNNTGLALARGETLVFLNNDTEVQPGWLGPLVATLQDSAVLGAQSLLIYPDGAVQSAGVVFPRGGGLPHMLLQGFPTEDTHGLETEPLRALTGAALALRTADVLALRGFDPLYRNGMEDVDICLRLGELRAGHFVVSPDSLVIHHESKSPGRFTSSVPNRRVFLDRWAGRLPQDDEAVWGRRGFDVRGHRITNVVNEDRRLCVAEPVLAKRERTQVREGLPRLRWALKNPAPFGPEGERWGDTHFARQLAVALQEQGQEVVIDHRGEFHRSSEWLDDVVLLLRGVAPYTPVPDRVNLMWVISHPDMVERQEHIGWDRVYVASAPFAARMAKEWGAPAVPLLQATDPSRFHPDAGPEGRRHPLLFVGNSRQQYRTLVKHAVDRQLPISVYGKGWEGLIPDSLIKGQYLPNLELGADYRAADVVLNDHWHDMYTQGFLSNRLFDAVAAGARVVSDDVPGLREVFGDAVQVVSTAQDLENLVTGRDLDEVFGSPEVRRQRAAWVAAEHSFSARARVLVQDAVGIWTQHRSR